MTNILIKFSIFNMSSNFKLYQSQIEVNTENLGQYGSADINYVISISIGYELIDIGRSVLTQFQLFSCIGSFSVLPKSVIDMMWTICSKLLNK